jgi:hypothetical protein
MKAKKWSLILLSPAVFATAFAATTLEFALTGDTYINNGSVRVNVKKLNKTLKQKNLEGLPEKIVVKKGSQPYWRVLQERIEAANKVSTHKMSFTIDRGYLYEFPAICYRGNIDEVFAIIEDLLGTFFNEGQGLLAERHGKTKKIIANEFKSEKSLKEAFGEDNPEDVKTWLSYKESSKTVLVMSNLGIQGDGTELYATQITPCGE